MVNSLGRTASEPVPAGAVGVGTALEAVEVGAVDEDFTIAVEKVVGAGFDAAADEAAAIAVTDVAMIFEDVAATAEDVAATVEDATTTAEDAGATAEDAAGFTAPPAPPALPTDVVRSPLSMYTPEKNQSSAALPSLLPGRRSTPRCQSAPLEDVAIVKGPAV
jgi:hypothetical protein